MMRFNNGMLGVCIVTVAIMGAVLGTYIVASDPEVTEITKYEYLTDVSGLFTYDHEPRFVEYNPSTNYTNYYSSTSGRDDAGNPYFDVAKVNYDPSNNANIYKLNLGPTDSVTDDVSLSSLTATKTIQVVYEYEQGRFAYQNNANAISIPSLITQLSWDEYDIIYLSSAHTEPIDWTSTTADWISFVPQSKLIPIVSGESVTIYNPSVAAHPQSMKAALSAKITIKSTIPIVELFETADYKNSMGQYSALDVFIAYNGTGSTFTLGDNMNSTCYDYPDSTYMNIEQGVSLK